MGLRVTRNLRLERDRLDKRMLQLAKDLSSYNNMTMKEAQKEIVKALHPKKAKECILSIFKQLLEFKNN